MNKNKITLGLIAFVLVALTSAFAFKSDTPVEKPRANAYFVYSGSSTSGENNASMWQKVASPSNLCLQGSNVLCTILAPIADAEDEHPDFTGISNVRTSLSVSQRVYKP